MGREGLTTPPRRLAAPELAARFGANSGIDGRASAPREALAEMEAEPCMHAAEMEAESCMHAAEMEAEPCMHAAEMEAEPAVAPGA